MAETVRQWPAFEAVVNRAAQIDAIDGLIALGSFAEGSPDELSDIDLLAVTRPGRFDDVWARRGQLAGDSLITWESRPTADVYLRWFKWLTRDVVKVECGVVDARSSSFELAEPFAVVLGEMSIATRFPRLPPSLLEQRQALLAEQQMVFDSDDMTDGERIDWKISEMKNAVRAALRHEHRG